MCTSELGDGAVGLASGTGVGKRWELQLESSRCTRELEGTAVWLAGEQGVEVGVGCSR